MNFEVELHGPTSHTWSLWSVAPALDSAVLDSQRTLRRYCCHFMSLQGTCVSFPSVRSPGDLLQEQGENRMSPFTNLLACAFHHCIQPTQHRGDSRFPPYTVWLGESERCVVPCSGKAVVTICSIFQSLDRLALPLTVLWVHCPQLSVFREHGFSFNTKLSKP